ncbi:MAG: NAD(P)-dependent alcohol dehydrogenase [Oceanospirillaceae bacterium]|nr:NAD(P)-dependent alcohol dehydrogenase [Oceanospirillaceae bacterium]MBT12698.1 NAD(P)-dependent alcohol dehydrogenase [Oceanospirillaceae bacterium]|tara:strand:- start:93144 stop:94157 length:1014 start_codon:yes stop_codon:yes gene_type:complete
MKAITLKQPGGLDHICVSELPDPGQPGRGEIRVAIKASSLNFHDLLVANGTSPTADDRILMSDGAGIVEAVGEGVDEFAPGDAVVSVFFPNWPAGQPFDGVSNFSQTPGDGQQGMAAEYVVRPATAFTHAPAGWSHEESATITTAALTAWRALVVDGPLKAGDTVLTLGTGGVSIAAIQLAKTMGARVIATSSSDDKLQRVKQLGADDVINYRTHPQWSAEVMRLTQGQGVDHIVEVGGPGTLSESMLSVKTGGHIALIGVLTGVQGEVPTAAFMARQARLQGLIVASRRDQQAFVTALEQTGIRPVIDTTFKFEQLADAFAHQQSGQHFGKICLQW